MNQDALVKVIEDEGEGERRQRYLSWGDEGLPLDREETNLAHRQMAAYKDDWGNPML